MFVVYFSTNINLSIIIKIIKLLRRHYKNRIILFIDKKKINSYKNKVSIYKSLNDIKKIEEFNTVIFAIKPQIVKDVVSQFNFLRNKKILFIYFYYNFIILL